MKKSNIYKLGIIFVVILIMGTDSVKATITDVSILPEEPTIIDLITIATFGIEGSGPVTINDSDFSASDTTLELDIFITVGHFAVITPWLHSEDIGFLPVGTYDLTVSTFDKFDPTFNDTFSTTFEVIPEPTSILLFATGMMGIRLLNRGASRHNG